MSTTPQLALPSQKLDYQRLRLSFIEPAPIPRHVKNGSARMVAATLASAAALYLIAHLLPGIPL